jgi:Tol biopolymer transport system component
MFVKITAAQGDELRMKTWIPILLLSTAMTIQAQVPSNLVAENLPAIPDSLREATAPYMEFRSAGFNSWHPTRREMLITTRFGNVPQLHHVSRPLGARKQLTFFEDRVGGGSFRPRTGDIILFSKDVGGGEFFQLYRYDLANGRVTLLTDGKSRNGGASWSRDGKWIAYTSTRRNGRDTDIWLMSPDDKTSDRMLLQREGGGWGVMDWSPDGSQFLLGEYVSANESYIHLVDVKSGSARILTPKTGTKVARGPAEFLSDGKSILFTSDEGREFQTLVRMNLARSPTMGRKSRW